MKEEQPILTVTEVTRRIKQMLEGGFPSVVMQGELSNFKQHTSGHLYFTLKDDAAQIAGVMWRSRAAGLTFTPQDGMKVLVTGRITVYEPRGAYQIDASSIRPLGVGELQMAFERLKEKLAAEGLFDASRKKPLPEYPERIGIVTSRTGAAIRDILNILGRRFPAITVILAPVRVQGPGAATEIAAAIDDFNRYGRIDVMIVGRGGGSLEDLWAFNEEVVARALARSLIPVVSAVGHEIDITIADFVADVRASTPSAAAELVVRDREAILEHLRDSCYTVRQSVLHLLQERKRTIRHLLSSYAFNRPIDLLRQFSQRTDELQRSMITASAHRLEMTQSRFLALRQRLASLDPDCVLKRGYAMVYKEGTVVGSSTALQSEDVIDVRFHDGRVRSTVT